MWFVTTEINFAIIDIHSHFWKSYCTPRADEQDKKLILQNF